MEVGITGACEYRLEELLRPQSAGCLYPDWRTWSFAAQDVPYADKACKFPMETLVNPSLT